jgi:hypothetical protein
MRRLTLACWVLTACGNVRTPQVTDAGLPDGQDRTADARPGAPKLTGTFVGGAVDQAGSVELHGAFVWHGAVSGSQGGITLEGWLR